MSSLNELLTLVDKTITEGTNEINQMKKELKVMEEKYINGNPRRQKEIENIHNMYKTKTIHVAPKKDEYIFAFLLIFELLCCYILYMYFKA